METVLEKSERYFRELVTFLYSWMSTDGEVLGYILGIWHVMVCMAVCMCGIISHTIYPVTWLQIIVYVFLCAVWLQHVFLKVCVVFIAERKLTNREPPFYEIIRNVLHIDPDQLTLNFVIAETVAVGCFGMELFAKLSLFLYEYYGVNL
jgi:hypothetical protein